MGSTMYKLSKKIVYWFVVVIVLSNFDENQQCLGLENNWGLHSFELWCLAVVTRWMGDPYMLGFAPAHRFLQSNSVQMLQKFVRWDYEPSSRVYTHMQKDHRHTVNFLLFMSEFGGLWKHQQQQKTCLIKGVKSLHNVEVGHYAEE